MVVVKERKLGLLIELDSTLTTILSTRVLQASQGFMHPELKAEKLDFSGLSYDCLLYTSPSPRDGLLSRMPSSA